MAFYLLTYFNDVNVGRNILINSHEHRQEKMKKKLRKTGKTPMKVTSVKMRYQI